MTPPQPLTHLRIILVEPAGALNVGLLARVMKNFDLTRLVIVNPQCEILGDQARQMAVHAADVLEQAQVVETLTEALAGCHRAIATTSVPRDLSTPLERPEVALPWLVERPDLETALIFGREDHGLSNAELNLAQRFVAIPSSDTYASLNLAQSVAVCAYVLRQITLGISPVSRDGIPPPSSKAPGLSPEPTVSEPLATLDGLEGFYGQLETVLLRIGYLYPHTATSRMAKFRQLFNRVELTQTELAMLRGILSQMDWAMRDDLRSPPTA